MRYIIHLCLLFVFFISAISSKAVLAESSNISVHGFLVDQPCNISPESTDIRLQFGDVNDKYLYRNTRTLGREFVIELTDCDISIAKSAAVTFSGTESIKLPGLIIPDSGDNKGIAFGFEAADTGRTLPINIKTPAVRLIDGTNDLKFKGYVQAEPDAISAHTIKLGPFTATATFTLDYF